MCNRTSGRDDYLGGTAPVYSKDENFCTRKHPHIPPNPSFRADPKADQRYIEKATFSFFIHQFSLKEKSIHKIWHVFSYKKTYKKRPPFWRAALPRLQEDVFCGDVASATSLLQTLEETCDLSWQEDAIFVGVLCRGSEKTLKLPSLKLS